MSAGNSRQRQISVHFLPLSIKQINRGATNKRLEKWFTPTRFSHALHSRERCELDKNKSTIDDSNVGRKEAYIYERSKCNITSVWLYVKVRYCVRLGLLSLSCSLALPTHNSKRESIHHPRIHARSLAFAAATVRGSKIQGDSTAENYVSACMRGGWDFFFFGLDFWVEANGQVI